MVKWRVCTGLHLNDDYADQGYSFGAVNRISNWNHGFLFHIRTENGMLILKVATFETCILSWKFAVPSVS